MSEVVDGKVSWIFDFDYDVIPSSFDHFDPVDWQVLSQRFVIMVKYREGVSIHHHEIILVGPKVLLGSG